MTEQRHSALGLLGSDTNFAAAHGAAPGGRAEGSANLGSDPKNLADHVELLKRRQIVRRTQIAGLVILVLLALGAGRTVLSRMVNARALDASSTEQA